ncbi:MAG: fluoride efflux transporter CrcB [Phycisphaeraceae bacterium]|nr:fluoride efflux transporter CrcB [Phycisphaeraceae bacterium]MCW5755051.1 fluoride efflux transporter CrcB [Phycisphaeraceae bacterium]
MPHLTWAGIAMVGIGGAAGAILRFVASVLLASEHRPFTLWATLAVNIVGCAIAGVILGLADPQFGPSTRIKCLLLTGFCGGLTTFSAFGAETFELLRLGKTLAAAGYAAGTAVIGIGALAISWWLARGIGGA